MASGSKVDRIKAWKKTKAKKRRGQRRTLPPPTSRDGVPF